MANTNKGDIAIRETLKAELRKAFAPRDVVFSELKWGQLKEANAHELNRSCDLFVIGGSGYIRPTKTNSLPPDMLEDAKALAELTCMKIAFGIGWNALLDGASGSAGAFDPAARAQLGRLLQSIDLVSVRDRATRDLVQDVSGKTAALVGDPALFYADLFPSATPPVRGRLRVGLNLALHGSASADRIERRLDEYCDFLRALSREHELTFHYVQHAQTECVIPKLLASRGIFVQRHDPPPEELIAFYRTLDIHICQMMHSSVLSLGALVPTMNFGYDIKNQGLFDLMDLKEFYFSAWSFDRAKALGAAKRMIAERPDLASRIATRKTELRADLSRFLNEISTRVAAH